ncbi:response regulator [Parvularcula maris]|uniref:Response regulator n=1 Tax=Parvularcula maris TaxID=2965077 RepID=A0A9X2L7Y3_9PROT|nr:response regulator [Parvularcula maris]MCQ8183832.1 response regulator [Parvularcula maris]
MNEAQNTSPASRASRRVLLLDDEVFLLLDLEMTFEMEGFEVLTATNCSEALKLLENAAVDVAVLDVNLGQGRTCAAVAEELTGQGVPFLLHTGDLDRRGELLRDLSGVIIPKPSPSEVVVAEASALL